MDDWKIRLKAEYAELKDRFEKLHRWNVQIEVSHRLQPCIVEKAEDDLNRVLLRDQEETMERYLWILEKRAAIYGIDLLNKEASE